MAIFLVELLAGGGDELVVELIFHQVDGAAAKAATHDARTGNATLASDVVQVVELNTAHLVVLAQPVVGLIHATAHGLKVATLQGVAHVEHALLLANDIHGALVVLVADLVARGLEHLHRCVAQGLNTQCGSHALTRLAALVVGRVNELMLYS